MLNELIDDPSPDNLEASLRGMSVFRFYYTTIIHFMVWEIGGV